MSYSRHFFAVSASITLAAGYLHAQDEPRILKLDANKDQTITKEEAGERWRFVERLDIDSDGSITPSEWKAAGSGGKGKRAPGALFDRLDSNKDGRVSKEEAPDRLWERISKADADGDGSISKEEIASLAPAGRSADQSGKKPATEEGRRKPKQGGSFDGSQFKAFIKRSDTNGDGKLQQDEVSNEIWSRISRIDSDGDGAIAPDEAERAAKMAGSARGGSSDKRSPAQMIAFYDKDGDGALAKSELSETMWARMSKADENADGKVSASELEQLFAGLY